MSAARQTLSRETLAAIACIGNRRELCASLKCIGAEFGASHYMLLGIAREHGAPRPRVIASNWIHDTILMLGSDLLASLVEEPGHGRREEAEDETLDMAAHALIREYGHEEVHVLRLRAGTRHCHALFSSQRKGAIDVAMLPSAQLACSYLVARLPDALFGDAARGSLSERERECLFWVAEGKTTDEVAVILGVTSNTVNSYIAHAIQKFGASNRAMAIATAIRTGTI